MTTAKKLIITDEEISQVLSLRELKKALTKNESQLIELLECGCAVNSAFSISINESFKTYPKYKEEIEKRLGEEILREIIESTQPKQFKKLVIAA